MKKTNYIIIAFLLFLFGTITVFYIDSKSYTNSIEKQMAKENWEITEENWNLYKSNPYSADHPFTLFCIKNKAAFEKIVGKSEIQQIILRAFTIYESENKNSEYLKTIDAELYEIHIEVKEHFKIYEKSRLNNENREYWDTYINATETLLSKSNMTPHFINGICWYVYQTNKIHKDPKALKLGLKWSKASYDGLPEDEIINDTYAHFLFESGFIKEAIIHQEIAEKKGFENKSRHLSFYTNEIQRFKKALSMESDSVKNQTNNK